MDFGFVMGQSITQAIGVTAIIYCLAAMGVNMQFGYTGLLNFGQVAFVAVGAYSVGVIVVTLGLTLWLAIPLSILASILLALLLGVPTLRLRADYLAIVTIAASEIVRQLVRSIALRDVLGGANGINGKMGQEFHDTNPFPADFKLPFLTYTRQDLWVVIVGWTLVALLTLLIWLLVRSPWGRVIKGIREDEDAVRALGKNVYAYKMQSLILGGVMGACGGIILALAKNFAGPDDFATKATFIAYTALILGGAATTFGPVIGGMMFWSIFTFVSETADQAAKANIIPNSVMTDVQAGVIPFIFLGIALMVLMVFRPQGIFGDRKELEVDVR